VTVWVVRAGEKLKYLDAFVSESVVGVGWSELPQSPAGLSRPELADLVARTYPDASPATVANYTGQVWNFVNTIALGDLVMVPLKNSKSYRLARIVGRAETRPMLRRLSAVRAVDWLDEEIPADRFGQDLRNAAGSIMTVFRPKADATERRVLSVLETGLDPGPDSGPEDRSGAWIFQANPKRYDLLASMERGREETWAVNQHRQDIQPGDRVWFRITGTHAGLYAVGTVTSLPREESGEFGDWLVDVDIEARIHPPLLRDESDADDLLAGVTALAGLMGTNLTLSKDADARLEEITESRLLPLEGADPLARKLERTINFDIVRLTEAVERDLLEHLRSLSHVEFEEVCALYLRSVGCEEVAVVGAATAGSLGDGGIDVTGTLEQPGLPSVRLAVQAKNVAGGVGPSVVTQLRGSVAAGTYGMIITTGHFTKSAVAEAARTDRTQIRLIDGIELSRLLMDQGNGVKKKPVHLPTLDVSGLSAALDAQRG